MLHIHHCICNYIYICFTNTIHAKYAHWTCFFGVRDACRTHVVEGHARKSEKLNSPLVTGTACRKLSWKCHFRRKSLWVFFLRVRLSAWTPKIINAHGTWSIYIYEWLFQLDDSKSLLGGSLVSRNLHLQLIDFPGWHLETTTWSHLKNTKNLRFHNFGWFPFFLVPQKWFI